MRLVTGCGASAHLGGSGFAVPCVAVEHGAVVRGVDFPLLDVHLDAVDGAIFCCACVLWAGGADSCNIALVLDRVLLAGAVGDVGRTLVWCHQGGGGGALMTSGLVTCSTIGAGLLVLVCGATLGDD